jgi:hypothetical protein
VLFLLYSDCRRDCNCVVFLKFAFVTALQLRCVVLLTSVAVVLPGVCSVQVVVMSLDITSGERNKTNVLTYVFRYYKLILGVRWLLYHTCGINCALLCSMPGT